MRFVFRSLSIPVLVSLLVACGQTAPPVRQAPPPVEAGVMLKHIRDAGKSMASAVEVQPLREPSVDGFMKQAESLESQGKLTDAVSQVDRALKLAPDAPEILQYRAELAVGLGRYSEAEPLARKSYDLGPRLGSLCARNWQTVVELRLAAQDQAAVDSAKGQLATCLVKPPVRM